MLYLRREAESGCVYGSRNFSKPKGAILFCLNVGPTDLSNGPHIKTLC